MNEKPIKDVYEKYKHLDKILSDKKLLDIDNLHWHCLCDCWEAIKEGLSIKPQ
jgi:hypothetical protein